MTNLELAERLRDQHAKGSSVADKCDADFWAQVAEALQQRPHKPVSWLQRMRNRLSALRSR
jgi:hypothetical protein